MQVFVGTSGWMYSWNKGQIFDWYVKNSELNAVELNASFYRFPFPSQVKSWAEKRQDLRFIIKVNRWITHLFRFNIRALATWDKFYKLFKPLDDAIDFYLFQLPPSTKPSSAERIAEFFKKTELQERFALEWRNEAWFTGEWVRWAEKLGMTLVSVDAPELPRQLFNVNGIVYVRMHGREYWYSHNYSLQELEGVQKNIIAAKPKKVYMMFNNDHNMLKNAQQALHLF